VKLKQYKKEIISVINKGIIENELHLIEYFNKKEKCEHFFHEKCKEKRNHQSCFLCNEGFKSRFICFFPINKDMINDLLFPINSNIYDNFQKIYFKRLIKEIRFELEFNHLIKKELRDKYYERIKICEEFRKMDFINNEFKVIDLSCSDLDKEKKLYQEIFKEQITKQEVEKLVESEGDKFFECHFKKEYLEDYRSYKKQKYPSNINFNELIIKNPKQYEILCYLLYFTIKFIDPRYINLYCPFCFKTKDGISILDPPKPIISKDNQTLNDIIIKKKIFLFQKLIMRQIVQIRYFGFL
jgi:hypothetical protein